MSQTLNFIRRVMGHLLCFMYFVSFSQNVSFKRAGIIMFCSLRSMPGTVSVQ